MEQHLCKQVKEFLELDAEGREPEIEEIFVPNQGQTVLLNRLNHHSTLEYFGGRYAGPALTKMVVYPETIELVSDQTGMSENLGSHTKEYSLIRRWIELWRVRKDLGL